MRPILSMFVDTVGDRDDALLDELEALVRARQRGVERQRAAMSRPLLIASVALASYAALNLAISVWSPPCGGGLPRIRPACRLPPARVNSCGCAPARAWVPRSSPPS